MPFKCGGELNTNDGKDVSAMRSVTVIPASIHRFSEVPLATTEKRKVAAYARVSTDNEGVTGTSMKKREGFTRMVQDALDGKIQLIVTKSVSRFARNTVDSLTTIRKLKEHGIEVYFEKEAIWTFQARGEILLTILSSLSQEEARSISENVTWGLRKRFADGKFSVGYSRFLGYDKGEDGNLAINEEQAKIVRLIFQLFLEGMTACRIAKELAARHILTVTGKEKWNARPSEESSPTRSTRAVRGFRRPSRRISSPRKPSRTAGKCQATSWSRAIPPSSTLPCSRWCRGRWSDAHGKAEDTAV